MRTKPRVDRVRFALVRPQTDLMEFRHLAHTRTVVATVLCVYKSASGNFEGGTKEKRKRREIAQLTRSCCRSFLYSSALTGESSCAVVSCDDSRYVLLHLSFSFSRNASSHRASLTTPFPFVNSLTIPSASSSLNPEHQKSDWMKDRLVCFKPCWRKRSFADASRRASRSFGSLGWIGLGCSR